MAKYPTSTCAVLLFIQSTLYFFYWTNIGWPRNVLRTPQGMLSNISATIYSFEMGLHLAEITSHEHTFTIKHFWKMFLHKFWKHFTIHVTIIMLARHHNLSKQNRHNGPCHQVEAFTLFSSNSQPLSPVWHRLVFVYPSCPIKIKWHSLIPSILLKMLPFSRSVRMTRPSTTQLPFILSYFTGDLLSILVNRSFGYCGYWLTKS